MARSPRSRQRTPARGRAAETWGSEGFDGTIEWDAKLLQPTSRITPGSVQPVVVEVAAPVVLDAQKAEIYYEGAWVPALWVGDAGHVRQAAATVVARAGAKSRVRVRVHSGLQQPVLDVGMIRVARS